MAIKHKIVINVSDPNGRKANVLRGAELKEYALQQALSGMRYEGFKVVEGWSVRKFSDDAVVAEAVKDAGI